MRKEIEEAINAVEQLKTEVYNEIQVEIRLFVTTDGYSTAIHFEEFVLWDSENDDREWFENKKEYEPIVDFLKKSIDQLTSEIVRINEVYLNKPSIKDTADKTN